MLSDFQFQNKVKIYSDGADKASMLEMNSNPAITGLTTNPSLMKKAGVSDYRSFCLDILKTIQKKPVSFEVFSDDLSEMKRQGMDIKTWGPNVYVKIPVLNSEGKVTYDLINELSHSGVKLNVTAILTMDQVLKTAEALKGGASSIVSVFAGRIADTGRDPMPTMIAASEICRATDPNMELLWASTREVYNIVQAEQAGCHIITVPPDIIKKMSGFNKNLLEVSLDTVRTFKKDSDAAGFKL
ncbi:MAG: transaldolase [Proteobacteria bacterium]|jgi:transaldolase|nr:transaldolase [Pseudomonadota bacterium]